MTAQPYAPPELAEATTLLRQLAECVDELAHVLGSCVVEDADGHVAQHRLPVGDLPDVLTDAVLRGSCRALAAAAHRPRTVCLLPTGHVVALEVAEHAFVRAFLPGGGSVWAIDATAEAVSQCAELLTRLQDLLDCSVEDSVDVLPWLDGDDEAPALAGMRLARVEASGVPPRTLARRVGSGTALRHRGAVYVLLGHREPLVIDVPEPVRGVVTSRLQDVARARRQLDTAFSSVPAGEVLTLEQVRPRAVVQHLARALASMPDFGDDPLAALRDQDRHRGSDLIGSLAAWLDASCDTSAAARALLVHPNTLRYRISRVFDVLGVDLRHDSAMRLEIQVRLRAEDRATTPR